MGWYSEWHGGGRGEKDWQYYVAPKKGHMRLQLVLFKARPRPRIHVKHTAEDPVPPRAAASGNPKLTSIVKPLV